MTLLCALGTIGQQMAEKKLGEILSVASSRDYLWFGQSDKCVASTRMIVVICGTRSLLTVAQAVL